MEAKLSQYGFAEEMDQKDMMAKWTKCMDEEESQSQTKEEWRSEVKKLEILYRLKEEPSLEKISRRKRMKEELSE
jgi:hypothetical protein